MSRITDEQLDQRLEAYHRAEPTAYPVFVVSKQPYHAVIPFYKKPQLLATAASIVLVTALGISLFFLFGNKNTIPIAPVSTVSDTETVSYTSLAPTAATEQSSVPTDGTSSPTKPRDTAAPTQSAADNVTSAATAPTAPTSDSQTPTQHPAEAASHPTQRATEKPTKPTQKPVTPTQKPTSAPTTQRATILPTEAPVTEHPTESSPAVASEIDRIEIRVPMTAIEIPQSEDASEHIYCRIFDENGQVFGVSKPYSSKRIVGMDYDAANNYQNACLLYTEKLNTPVQGGKTFTFEIYDKHSVLYRGTVTV